MKKNFFAIISIIIILISCSCSNTDDSKDMSINKALQISKNYLDLYFDIKIKNTSNEKLEIVKDKNNENINYNFSFLDDDSKKTYHLSFNNDENYTNFTIYYDILLQNKTISYEDALKIANAFIEKKFNDKDIKVLQSDYLDDKNDAYEYNFVYTRVHDSIPYDDNGVNITVNANSKITYLSLNWNYNISFPKKTTKLNEENINKLFYDKLKLNLSYMDIKNSLIPVYQIDYNHGSYLDAYKETIINPYKNTDTIVYYDIDIDDLKNNTILDIKDKTNHKSTYNKVNIIREKFIPKDFKFSYKDDYKNYKNYKITNYSYSNNKSLASISFNHTTNEVENIFIPFDKKSSLKAVDFDRKEYSYKKALYYISLLGNKKLEDINLNAYNYPHENSNSKKNPIYYFNFVRKIGNIPYESNSIYIGINSTTGTLQNYNLLWDDIYNIKDIENNIKNIKSEKEIKTILLKDISYIPVYLKVEDDIIFAYKLVIDNNKNLVNAITGDFIK